MEPSAEIKKRVLINLPFAYQRLTMSRLDEWIETFKDEERDYAYRVAGYIGKLNSNPSTRVWGVDSDLVDEILKKA
jgi:hypothetical protein